MYKVTWIIDEILLEKHDQVGFPSLAEAVREQGHKVIITKYVPFSDNLSEDLDIYVMEDIYNKEPVIAYGCINFIKQLIKNVNFNIKCPGVYFNINELKFSKYASYFGDKMLSNDFVMLPYGEIERRGSSFFGNKFFIRPDVVTKSFAGRVVDFGNIAETPEALSQYEPIDKSEICVIASPKEIVCEARILIVNKKVVAQSTYRFNGKLDIRSDVFDSIIKFGQNIAESDYFPDYVYILDLAMTSDNEVKIIEFNTFSCAGLYGMDTRNIVKSVSEMAWKEYTGDV